MQRKNQSIFRRSNGLYRIEYGQTRSRRKNRVEQTAPLTRKKVSIRVIASLEAFEETKAGLTVLEGLIGPHFLTAASMHIKHALVDQRAENCNQLGLGKDQEDQLRGGPTEKFPIGQPGWVGVGPTNRVSGPGILRYFKELRRTCSNISSEQRSICFLMAVILDQNFASQRNGCRIKTYIQ